MEISSTYRQRITALQLAFNTEQNEGKTLVLVEGEDDARLYRKFFTSEGVKIDFMNGKNNVEKALRDIDFVHAIGVCDADFIHLEQRNSPLPHLFLTDVHDIELLIAFNDSSFRNVFCEYFWQKTDSEMFDIRYKTLRAITFLGYIRWYNEQNNLSLSFDHIDLRQLFHHQRYEIPRDSLLEKIMQQSPNAAPTELSDLLIAIYQIIDPEHDLWQLCNGHDFMKILASCISKEVAKKAITDQTLSRHFRTAYHFSDFQTTRLYQQLCEWSTTHHLHLFPQ